MKYLNYVMKQLTAMKLCTLTMYDAVFDEFSQIGTRSVLYTRYCSTQTLY